MAAPIAGFRGLANLRTIHPILRQEAMDLGFSRRKAALRRRQEAMRVRNLLAGLAAEQALTPTASMQTRLSVAKDDQTDALSQVACFAPGESDEAGTGRTPASFSTATAQLLINRQGS